jgi:hypothetical protein
MFGKIIGYLAGPLNIDVRPSPTGTTMKIHQNPRHWAAKKALTTPGVASLAHASLVKLHTKIFVGKADEAHREERRDHLDGFFGGSIDTYTAALEEGHSEAEAREITHIQGNFDFYNHAWTEMMEFPVDELDEHYVRYEDFFERHGITIDNPLGEFEPVGGVPDAPSTPERLDADQSNAVGGYADDVYVEGDDGEITEGGKDEPENVSVSDAVGVSGSDAETTSE